MRGWLQVTGSAGEPRDSFILALTQHSIFGTRTTEAILVWGHMGSLASGQWCTNVFEILAPCR